MKHRGVALWVSTPLAINLMLFKPAVSQELWDQLAGAVQQSVVELLVIGPNSDSTNSLKIHGSGFVVHTDSVLKKTFILTAAHVVGPSSEWAPIDLVSEKPNRNIRVRIQLENTDFKKVDDNASVIDENPASDFAILAVAQQEIKSLTVASSSQLKKARPVLVAGFPQDSGYKGRIINIWSVDDLSNSRVTLDGRAEPGQSGGAVVDAQGRVVALVSENDNKQSPQFHNAVIVSEPIEALNRYLRKRGRPEIFLEDASPLGPKFYVHDRSGSAFVRLTGDVGELSVGKQQDSAVIGTTTAPISAVGNERSDCIQSFDQSNSGGSGLAWIQPFELTGLKLRLKATAKGGHFSKATCLKGRPIGIKGQDTSASSAVGAEGTIPFQTTSIPFDLRIVWHDMPAETKIELIDPSSLMQAEITPPEANSERVVRIEKAGNWQLKVRTGAEARATGGTTHTTFAAQPLVFLEAR